MSTLGHDSAMRSSLAITWAVWRALFLREAVARVSVGRAAWLWIVVEPFVHLVFLNLLFGYILGKMISGVNAGLFITIGIIGYFSFNHTAMRSKEAITANRELFTYRQVLPVDTIIIRAVLEAIVLLLSALILLTGLWFVGADVLPNDLPLVMMGLVFLWLTGLGVALVLSAAIELIPEISKVVNVVFYPLYFLSGVMYPLSSMPPAYQQWLLVNPLIHGIETIRIGFFRQYHAEPGVSLGYLFSFAVIVMGFGLALHVRYGSRLVAQ